MTIAQQMQETLKKVSNDLPSDLKYSLKDARIVQGSDADQYLLMLTDTESWLVGVATVTGFGQKAEKIYAKQLSDHEVILVWFLDEPKPILDEVQHRLNIEFREEIKRRRYNASPEEKDQLMRKLMEKYANEEVTYQDSRDARNCHDGTKLWMAANFPDRPYETSGIKLGELIPFLDTYQFYEEELRGAIAYKLLKLKAIESMREVL